MNLCCPVPGLQPHECGDKGEQQHRRDCHPHDAAGARGRQRPRIVSRGFAHRIERGRHHVGLSHGRRHRCFHCRRFLDQRRRACLRVSEVARAGSVAVPVVDDIDRCSPAVAEAEHRPDRGLLAAGVPDRTPRPQQGLCEYRIADVHTSPHGRNQFVAADRPFALIEQIRQAIERFRRQRHAFGTVPELARGRIDDEIGETENRVRHLA